MFFLIKKCQNNLQSLNHTCSEGELAAVCGTTQEGSYCEHFMAKVGTARV